MRRSHLLVLAAIAGACGLGVVLWRFWTPRCNEGCPPWIAMTMMAWVAALPIAAAVSTWIWVSVDPTRRLRVWLPAFLVLLMLASAVFLTLVAN